LHISIQKTKKMPGDGQRQHIAASGFMVMALPLGLAGLCVGLVPAGVGSGIQVVLHLMKFLFRR
jgi:hypothetical protein